MRKNYLEWNFKMFLTLNLFFSCLLSFGQQLSKTPSAKNFKLENVQFGGGLGLNISNLFTEITISPSAIYNFNPYFALGAGLQYGYISSKNNFTSNIYGGSIIGLLNPINEIQFSTEIEKININTSNTNLNTKTSFWTTSLYLGAGYRTGNVTIGVRYNILLDKDRDYNGNGLIPFVRAYF